MTRATTIDGAPPRRELWPWLLVPLVLAAGGGVGALLAIRANERDRRAATSPPPRVAAVHTVTQSRPTTAPSVSLAPAVAAVTVPDLRGKRLPDARKTLREAGLVVDERKVSSALPKQTVVAQSPSPGTSAEHGDHVLVIVSHGSKHEPGHGHGRGHGPKERNQ